MRVKEFIEVLNLPVAQKKNKEAVSFKPLSVLDKSLVFFTRMLVGALSHKDYLVNEVFQEKSEVKHLMTRINQKANRVSQSHLKFELFAFFCCLCVLRCGKVFVGGSGATNGI